MNPPLDWSRSTVLYLPKADSITSLVKGIRSPGFNRLA